MSDRPRIKKRPLPEINNPVPAQLSPRMIGGVTLQIEHIIALLRGYGVTWHDGEYDQLIRPDLLPEHLI